MAQLTNHELNALPYERTQWAESATTLELLNWLWSTYGTNAAFGTAFGKEGCALIDLSMRSGFQFDFFTLNTGYFFPETLKLWRDIELRYNTHIRGVRPELDIPNQDRKYGPKLHERDPNSCCYLRKVKPLDDALKGKQAWLTGLRRTQSPSRAATPVLEWDTDRNLIKVNPLASWTNSQLDAYLTEYRVLVNPLHAHGYPSIGCQPCTSKVQDGEDQRAGRWRGNSKTECGLHPESPQRSQKSRLKVLPGGQP